MTPLLLISLPVFLVGFAYIGYPCALWILVRIHRPDDSAVQPGPWPMLTITVPAYNEAESIEATLSGLLQIDYPPARLHILVVSDASTDGTDDIVRGFADRGVELLRLPTRGGKSVAENAAATRLRGDIVVNLDASVRIPRDAMQPLIRAFQDPEVGVASGRDVSVSVAQGEANQGESGYVGYEMWVRRLETQLGGIVGASGCFYAIRRQLYDSAFPARLSRDFGNCLRARRAGFRAVSVEDAVCFVPRTKSLRAEFRRKTRTMARGLATLWYFRSLLNPLRYRGFALKLICHKLCRWLVPMSFPGAVLGLVLLATQGGWALVPLVGSLIAGGLGIAGIAWPDEKKAPKTITRAGFILAANLAGILAWIQALSGRHAAVWEPTRRSG